MGDANIWDGFGAAVADLVENMRLWTRKLESSDYGTASQAAEDAHSTRLLIKAQIGIAAKLRDQIFDQVTEERDEAARQAAKIKHAASICEHPNSQGVIFNDLVDPPGRLSVGWCPECGAYSRKHPMGGIFDGEWHVPGGYAKLLALLANRNGVIADLQKQLAETPSGSPSTLFNKEGDGPARTAMYDAKGAFVGVRSWAPGPAPAIVDNATKAARGEVDTSVWPAISSAQAASVVALEAEVERLVGVLRDIDDKHRRVIASRDAEIERLNRMLDGRDEGIPLNELPADLRADMQAMDVAEAKSQLASDEGLKVARVLVAKLRKKYDQDVVQGIVDDLIRTKQTGAGLYGLSPGEKEFVCLSRVHIADDPTPRIPVFFSVGLRPSAQDGPAAPSAVDHPAHYGGADNPYEAIKVIEAWNLEFCTGSAVKYIARAGKKDATKLVEDLQKAVWYLRRRIEQLGGDK